MVQERDANNLPQVTYTRGNDLSGDLQDAGGIGGLLARTDMGLWTVGSGQATAFYQSDGNGNITCMVNTNGMIVAHYEYDPFGNTLSMSGPLAAANRYRFSSKEWNDNAGIYYYGFRFYDPNLQRWPNRDPLGDLGGLVYRSSPFDPQADSDEASGMSGDEILMALSQINLNLYGSLANNPLSFADLFGLDCYQVNRQLWPKLLNHDPWPRSRYDYVSHTFVITTNPDGTLAHTYSWGTDKNSRGWYEDFDPDKAAARQALKDGGNYLKKIGDSSLDPFVQQAFNNLNQKQNEHGNGWIVNNCKSEAKGLESKAKKLQTDPQNQTQCSGN
ncbi:MAG TPA: RHS repeat-associated core domain-containing protein [Verrucomicrobiae bacterium]|nr:RHS repeat-associated core domain-containing protein [Verrucomicrobiae bacterium]